MDKAPGSATSQQPRIYYGFISYSHRDSALVRRLHRELEQYRVPQRLLGKPSPVRAPAYFLRPGGTAKFSEPEHAHPGDSELLLHIDCRVFAILRRVPPGEWRGAVFQTDGKG